jgi:hypothetical protein
MLQLQQLPLPEPSMLTVVVDGRLRGHASLRSVNFLGGYDQPSTAQFSNSLI